MRKNTYLALFLLLFNNLASGQSINNWQLKENLQASKIFTKIDRKSTPSKYKVFALDFKSLKTKLRSASKRSQNNKLATTLLLDFPNDKGSTESFSIEKVSVLHPDLEAKYSEIQSFYGVSKQNPLNKIYISMSPEGFTGLITGEKTIYIDPFAKNDTSNYIVYDRKDCSKNPDDSWVCNAIVDETMSTSKNLSISKTTSTTDGSLRTYKLALACTSAYSLYYGNTIAQVLAAMNTTITRVNSVYRRDLSVVFQIVASNDKLIYIDGLNKDGASDPYDNYDGNGMLAANTASITGLITVGAYDIGHVFSTGGGGIAGTSPCTASTKGKGVTGIVTPQFDPFDIDYVCHEIGHQFGAGHTYYNACFGSKVTDDYEPGSASTIMGYAGICAPNVQGNSDAYFHARSIEQMTAAISGHSCVTGISTGNTAPVIAALTARTIPKSTPFILTGSATDSNTADLLTYTWEQYDNVDGGIQPPTSTNAAGPIFRSVMPTIDPTRTFPNLAAVISNTTPTWEVLPSVSRTLNFRLTVRDNSTLGGRTDFKTVAITVGAAGPFAVTSPNLGTEIWYVGETKAVTWNVASTNTTTYSTTVNIKLSTDGGYTYPINLATGVANSGTANITVPNNIGKLNRIKIEAAANIFFDLSNANFEIKSGKFEMTSAQPIVSVCKPTSAVYTINYTPAPTFSETTTFSAIGNPAGSIVSFSPTTRSTAGAVTITVSNISAVTPGNYSITVNGTSTTSNINFPTTLNVFDSTIGNVTLSSPTNGATNQQTSSLLQWNTLSSASSYLVQISTSPTFSIITESATVTGISYQTTLLTQGTINYWRVRPINTCTSGNFSEVYVFQIASDLCKTYSNVTFLPNAIWETNSNNAVSAKIDIPDNIVVSDVNFYMKATHPLLSDLKIQFSGPTGIFAEIYNRDCSGANIDVTFDDSGSAIAVPCSGTLSGIKQASQTLSKFNGSSSLGVWTLLATDRVSNTSGGTFTNFTITICGKLQIVNNIALINSSINIAKGGSQIILQSKLGASQPTATAIQLIYVVTQLPTNGILKLNTTALTIGDTFTQADINNNLIAYTNNGLNANPDSFKFALNGINTAILGGQTFNLNICAAPVPNIASLPDINGQCATTITAPTATSSCYGQITGTTSTIFPVTAAGTTVISWSFNDENGQTVTANQNVIVGSTTWNGSAWSNGLPASGMGVIIAGNYNATTNLTACSLTINNNAVVLVKSGINFDIYGDVIVSPGSSLTFENNTNLVQTKNTNGNSGNIILNRNSASLKLLDYSLWSSPVSGQKLKAFSPLTLDTRFYTYNPSSNLYAVVPSPSTTDFATGTGYLVRMPNTVSPTIASPYNGVFTGIPNNGTVNLTVNNDTFNAIGNPYPSTISANAFISANSTTGTLYFWRKSNNSATTSYATYTTAGGVANSGDPLALQPNGTIQVGQGFIVKANTTTITFTNAMRTANNLDQFLKTKAIERNRIWLNLSAGAKSVNQMMVAYMDGATTGIDDAIDGRYINDNPVALNSSINGEEFVIQGKGLPFDIADTVPLAFKTNAAGTFTIGIDHVDGLFSNKQDIYLKDNSSGFDHNLNTSAYTFISDAGTFNSRFQLTYKITSPLGVNNPVFDINSILIYKQNGMLNINAGKTIIKTVRVFDIRGRLITEQKAINSNVTTFKSFNSPEQALLIQITSDDNNIVTKKVIF